MEAFSLLPDPQTNGGLLFSVSESYLDEVKNLMKTNGYEKFVEPVGVFTERKEKVITVGL
jgi:selenide,water dikinase